MPDLTLIRHFGRSPKYLIVGIACATIAAALLFALTSAREPDKLLYIAFAFGAGAAVSFSFWRSAKDVSLDLYESELVYRDGAAEVRGAYRDIVLADLIELNGKPIHLLVALRDGRTFQLRASIESFRDAVDLIASLTGLRFVSKRTAGAPW